MKGRQDPPNHWQLATALQGFSPRRQETSVTATNFIYPVGQKKNIQPVFKKECCIIKDHKLGNSLKVVR
jgi:hypothetical protein